MSLPNDKDRLHDHIAAPIDELIQFLRNLPDRATIEADKAFSREKAELCKLERIRQQLQNNMAARASPPLNEVRVEELIITTCHLFFNNKIFEPKEKISFGWMTKDSKKLGIATTSNGGRVFLRVNAFESEGDAEMMGTFLHELLHIFVNRCRYRHGAGQCSSSESCCKVDEKLKGKMGHGWHWQRLACELEKASGRMFGKSLDLGRFEAIVFEALETEVPSLEYFKALHELHPFPEYANLEDARRGVQTLVKEIRTKKEKVKQKELATMGDTTVLGSGGNQKNTSEEGGGPKLDKGEKLFEICPSRIAKEGTEP